MMGNTIIKGLFVLSIAILISFPTGCVNSAEKRNIEAVVREYNVALMKAYETLEYQSL